MPPKCRFTREEVIAAALEMVREQGMEAVTARALGERLGTSSRPIFSLFESMEEVRQGVIAAADERYQACLRREMETGQYPPYKASGMGYIRFAREEKELFRLLFMRDRTGEEIAPGREWGQIAAIIKGNTGLTGDAAAVFHTEMWMFVHGIAVTLATSYLPWDEETVSRMLTDAYLGLRARYEQEGAHGSRSDH